MFTNTLINKSMKGCPAPRHSQRIETGRAAHTRARAQSNVWWSPAS